MFEFRRVGERQARAPWLASAVLHAIVLAVVVVIAWRAQPRTTFITLSPPVVRGMPALPQPRGSAQARGPSGGLGHPAPTAPAPPAPVEVVIPPPVPPTALDSIVVGRKIVSEPRLSNPLIWVSPRPALPAEVAAKLYGPHDAKDALPRDTIVVRRLRAMVDSMNHIIDAEQRQGRRPTWMTDVAGKKLGMDSANIYIAGIKIPTAVLMAFGSLVPQGNYDEAMRIRQVDYLREDIMQAAARTQNLQDFRSYVSEMRKRKQSERDAARHQRDTVVGVPDTVRVHP